MTIKLELPPPLESSLLAQARARGLSLEAYAQELLEECGHTVQPASLPPAERLTAFHEFVRGLESQAIIPEEAFHRESWYPDRG
jgi:hypothetical protein